MASNNNTTDSAKVSAPAPAPAPIKTATATAVPPTTKPTVKASSPALDMLNGQLSAYVEAMKPAQPMTMERVIQNQLALWRAITMIFQQPASDFPALWAQLLLVAKSEAKGSFAQSHLFRGFQSMKGRLTDGDINNFKNLLNLISQTADATVRARKLKMLDLGSVTKGFANPEVAQRLKEFYGL